jgi:transcriptional regulator with XRE-family HTH domain
MPRALSEKIATLPTARRKKIEERARELIAQEMSLREIRKAMGKTQAKIAAALGVGQDSVARYEQRTDMLLSTLSQYIHKVGGTLELMVRFPNREPIRIRMFSEISNPSQSSNAPKEHAVALSRKPLQRARINTRRSK